MFLICAFVVGLLGQLSAGVPLESPSSDFSQFFKQRIVGGSEAAQGHSPHMAALVVGYDWQSLVCGGSIITEHHVLTAAHCVTGFIQWNGELLSTFHAIVGTNTWHSGTIVNFKDYKLHPHYDSWNIKNDAGVLIASKKIHLNERVQTIGMNFGFVGAGEKSFVTGWGTIRLWGPVPDTLQILDVEVIDRQQCIQGVKEAAAQWGGWAPRVDPELEICTFHSAGHGMCHGDSGSALVSVESGLQSGVVSWGIPCAVGGPDVFVRLGGCKDFILGVIKHK